MFATTASARPLLFAAHHLLAAASSFAPYVTKAKPQKMRMIPPTSPHAKVDCRTRRSTMIAMGTLSTEPTEMKSAEVNAMPPFRKYSKCVGELVVGACE